MYRNKTKLFSQNLLLYVGHEEMSYREMGHVFLPMLAVLVYTNNVHIRFHSISILL